MYHFNKSDLNIKTVAQLKDVYSQIGCTEAITDKRIKANWVQAILTHQSALVEKITVAEIAQILLQPKAEERSTVEERAKVCATCPLFKSFGDGTGRGLCCGSDTVARDHHPTTGDCLHMIEDAKSVGQHLLRSSPDGGFRPADFASDEFSAGNNKSENFPQGQQAASNLTENLPEGYQPSISTNVQSGSLIFKPVEDRIYEVWNNVEKYGAIKMLEDGLWSQSYASATTYGTPYAAAAALVEATQLRQTRSADIQVLENWNSKFVVRNIQNGCHYVVQPNHPDNHERCECGDCHYRGVVCKHQVAVADHIQIESLSDDIEVDSVSDPDFGLLYRVWKGWELLGTFYHALDSKWVAQPCESDVRPRSETANQAQLLILAMAGMLVVGEVCGTEDSVPRASREEDDLEVLVH